ncbi:MAG: hypothetical protein JNL67_00790 [Planctomycetaceae bacterium]|nr:hypothetical protein [Planctomycetaceae bacterium]
MNPLAVLGQQASVLRPAEKSRPPSTLPLLAENQQSNRNADSRAIPSAGLSTFVADGSAVNPAEGSGNSLDLVADGSAVSSPPIRLKLTLGGEKPVRWEGHLRLQSPNFGTWSNLNLLSIEPKTLGLVRLQDEPQEIQFLHTDGITYNTFQVDCLASLDSELELQLRSPDNPQWTFYQKLTLGQLVEAPWSLRLANSGHGIWIERPEFDQLLLESNVAKEIFEPGETFQLTAIPNRLRVSQATALKYHAQITELSRNTLVWEERGEVAIDQAGGYLPLKPFQVTAGPTSGVYQFQLDLSTAKSTITSLLPANVVGNSVIASRQKQWVVGPSSWDRLTPAASESLNASEETRKSNRATSFEIVASQLVSPSFRPFELQRLQILQRIQPFPRPKEEPFATRSSETLRTTEANGKMLWELGPNQWRIIELPQLDAGAYWVEVELDNARSGPLELDVVQTDRWGRVPHWTTGSLWSPINDPLLLDIVSAKDKSAIAPQWRSLHWLNPAESHPGTMLCLTNRNPEKTIRIAAIRVEKYELASRNASDEVIGKRQVGYYLEAPLLTSIFSARKPAPTAESPPLNDWLSYHDAVGRLVQFLRAKNYNSVWLPVIKQGGTLFPLDGYQTLPRFENSSFGNLSQGNSRLDVLELLLREFSHHQMALIPVLDFSIALPARSQEPVLMGGPLDPVRQRQVLDIVQQIGERYRHHAAFQGVAIELNPESPLLFRSLGDGLNPDNTARFCADHSITWPETTMGSLAEASPTVIENWVLQNHSQRWLQWRAKRLNEFFEQVHASLQGTDSSHGHAPLKLHLVVANFYRHPMVQEQVYPSLRRQPNWAEHWLQLGLNLQEFQEKTDGPRLVLQQSSRHNLELPANRREIVTTKSPEFWQTLSSISNLDFISQSALNHSTVDALSDKPSDHVGQSLLSFGVVTDGTGCEATWAEALRRQDVRNLLNQSGGLARSEQPRERAFATAFSHLLEQEFVAMFQDPSSPVAIRQLAGDNPKSQFYIVNAAPWPASCWIDAYSSSGEEGVAWNNVVTNELIRAAKMEPSNNRLQPVGFNRSSEPNIRVTLELAPYSLTVLEGPPIQISQVHVREASGEVIEQLQELKASLFRRLRQATTSAVPLDSIRNAGFEEPLRQAIASSPANWSHGALKEGQQIDQDSGVAHSGTTSLRVRNSEGILWLRSNSIPPPTTGRLSVTAWIRANPQQPLPSLRLAIDGQGTDERKYYRFAEIPLGQSVDISNGTPSNGEWLPIAVHFDDIPETGLTSLRVGFDVLKSGEIWIDSIQCFDRWLDANDQNVLSNRLGLAAFSLDTKQNSWAALQTLDDYWLRFLVAHVSDPNQLADSSSGQAQPASEPPSRSARGARRFLPLR